MIGSIIIIVVLVFLFVLFYYRQNRSVFDFDPKSWRGTPSENHLIKRLKKRYKETAVYHDLFVPRYNTYSQIDAVLCTDVGLIVIEVKDYAGWIFGNAEQKQWTQVSGYGANKYRFYNPVMQNAKHIEALKEVEELRDVPMFSLILFYGGCELKDVTISQNIWLGYGYEVFEQIQDIVNNNPVYNYGDKWAVANKLKEFVDLGEILEIRQIQREKAQEYNKKNGFDNTNYGKGYPAYRPYRHFRRRRYW